MRLESSYWFSAIFFTFRTFYQEIDHSEENCHKMCMIQLYQKNCFKMSLTRFSPQNKSVAFVLYSVLLAGQVNLCISLLKPKLTILLFFCLFVFVIGNT